MSRYGWPSHRVYMSFFLSRGWYCQFLEMDLKTSLPKKLTFASADKVRELAELGGATANLENKRMLGKRDHHRTRWSVSESHAGAV